MMGRGDGDGGAQRAGVLHHLFGRRLQEIPEVVKRWKLSSAVQRPLSSAQRNASAERFKTWRPETDGAIRDPVRSLSVSASASGDLDVGSIQA